MCCRSFHWALKVNKERAEKIWFVRWLTEGYAVRQLTIHSRHRHRKLRSIINHWLQKDPPLTINLYGNYRHLMFDGSFLVKRLGLVVLMNAPTHTIIAGEYGVSENSFPKLVAFLQPLKEQGLEPRSCTVDGNPQAIRVLTYLWPQILIQRCLVHVQRQGLMWCRRNPSRLDARKLRKIFLLVTKISTAKQKNNFIAKIQEWEKRYGYQLDQLQTQGWVLSDLKRARSMLQKALPYMFHYLKDPTIPTTTNGLEGYFGRLKQHYRHHRGLAPHKRKNYFKWYFYLRPR